MERNGMEWSGMGRNGREWSGVEWSKKGIEWSNYTEYTWEVSAWNMEDGSFLSIVPLIG